MSYKYFADDDYAVYRVDAAAPDEGLAPARFELGPEAAAVVIDPRTRDAA